MKEGAIVYGKTICFLFFAITMVFLVLQAEGANWIYMGIDEVIGIEWSYDLETVAELPTGIMKVRILKEYSDEGRKKEIQWRISEGLDVKGYDTLSKDFSLCEVNCITREYRLVEISYHSTDGKVLYSHSFKPQPSEGWRPVPPGTMAERLYEAICPPQEKK